MGVWSERDLGQTVIQSKRKLNCIKGRTLSKVIGWGDGAGDDKKIIRKKKIVEGIKGMLKKERKKEKNMQVENSPPPP